MKAKLLLILFSILVALLIVEVGLRLFWENPYSGSGPDRVLELRVHHANVRQRFDRKQIDSEHPTVTYRTNERSYLEPILHSADADLTIAFLGASTTECMAVREELRFPFLVAKLLDHDSLSVSTINAARSGGTLHDSINILLNRVVLDRPDIAVLMHAANDIGVLKRDPDYSTRMGHDISLADLSKYVLQMWSTRSAFAGYIRQAATTSGFKRGALDARPAGTIEDVEPFRARLKIFTAISRALGIVPVLMTQPLAASIQNELTSSWVDADNQDALNQVIREVGAETDTKVIDLATYISDSVESDAELRRVFYDALHVTDYGSSLYAAYIAEQLSQTLNLTGMAPTDGMK